MEKWTVILTVIAYCILGVLSQADVSNSSTFIESPENNTSANDADAIKMEELNSPSFPPLIHEITTKTPSIPTVSVTVKPTAAIEIPTTSKHVHVSTETEQKHINNNQELSGNNKNGNSSTTTEKPNSSNILQGSFMAIIVGVLICKFGF